MDNYQLPTAKNGTCHHNPAFELWRLFLFLEQLEVTRLLTCLQLAASPVDGAFQSEARWVTKHMQPNTHE